MTSQKQVWQQLGNILIEMEEANVGRDEILEAMADFVAEAWVERTGVASARELFQHATDRAKERLDRDLRTGDHQGP